MGPVARDAGHREVSRLADGHAHGARGVDPVTMAVDEPRRSDCRRGRSSTSIRRPGREAEAGRWLAQRPSRARIPGHRAAGWRSDDGRFNVLATVGTPDVVLSTHFDCVPPFFPSRIEGDRSDGPRRVRCEGDSRRAGRGGRAAAARGRDPRRPPVRGRRGARQRRRSARRTRGRRVPVSRGRRADRQPSRAGDSRSAPVEVSRLGPRGALVVSRARRIGDRQADRRARRAALDRVAGRSGARPDALHDRSHRRRRRAQRRARRRPKPR